MLELAFTACLLTSPGQCEDRSLLFVDVTPMQCVIGAQAMLASWRLDHPGWRIGGYRCQFLDERVTEL